MRRYLLPERGKDYKANLHCHTTVSDGALTPEEVKRIYREQGYSIVAYTDHELLVPHHDLADAEFLPLSGVEFAINGPGKTWPEMKVCHICCIAMDPEIIGTPGLSRWYVAASRLTKNEHLAHAIPGTADYPREYGARGVSALIAMIRKQNFFVTYNHPSWSQEDLDDYGGYENLNAMEIYNHGCAVLGYDAYEPQAYDALLRRGNRIYCLADDDNHNHGALPGDSFGGWVVIRAEALDYRTVTQALAAGQFYASQGPQIHALWLEDGKAHLTCSEAVQISVATAVRGNLAVRAQPGEHLTHAEFPVSPKLGYIRFTVTDDRGRHANTNAYFPDAWAESE